MQAVPISNEAISDVVWAALELSDRCKGGTDININVLPSGAVVLDLYLQGYNNSPEYRQYRIATDEDAQAALSMIVETKDRKNLVPNPTVKQRIKARAKDLYERVIAGLEAAIWKEQQAD